MRRRKTKMAKKPSNGDYKRYVEWYHKQEEIVARKGHKMWDSMYTEKRFKEVYKFTKNDLELQVKAGQRKAIGNVYQYMARDQSYLMDYSTQKALRNALPNVKPSRFETLDEVKRRMTDADWDYVHQVYNQAKYDGMTGKEAYHFIAQAIFGSP